ncbi:MAG: mechanosensitive ion channel [Pseudomonadota bacterium]|nr:mechanosensitive ion channel [Pseudomonadota bacterium]
MRDLARSLGVTLPATPDLQAAGIAALVLGGTVLLAWLASWQFGPKLAGIWERRLGSRVEGLAPRMCALVRYLIAAVLLAIALRVADWPPLAALVLGLPAALASAMAVVHIVRGVHLAPWVAAALGGFVFFAVLADALGGLAPIRDILDDIGFNAGQRRFSLLVLIQIGVTLLALYAVVSLIIRFLGHTIRRVSGLDPTQQLLAQKLAAVAVVVAAFFIGIDLVGIDLTALAVFSGAFGLAVGFGLQKTFGNLIAGIILLMDRSIKPGDVIAVGDSFGHVTKIGVRAVSIVTRDGKEHLIPNENLMTQEVENWSYSNRDVRVHIPVGVAYDCDLPLAQRLMIQAAKESHRVMQSPPPRVWLLAFGESSVDHEILVWIRDPEAGVGNVQSEILNRLWVLFKENDIAIPFPQRDIHVKDWPSAP